MRCTSVQHDIGKTGVHDRLSRHDKRASGLEDGTGHRKPPGVAYRKDHRHPHGRVEVEDLVAQSVVLRDVLAAQAHELGAAGGAARRKQDGELRSGRLPLVHGPELLQKFAVDGLRQHQGRYAAVDASYEDGDGVQVLAVDHDLHGMRLESGGGAVGEARKFAVRNLSSLPHDGNAIAVEVEDRSDVAVARLGVRDGSDKLERVRIGAKGVDGFRRERRLELLFDSRDERHVACGVPCRMGLVRHVLDL